MAQRMSSAVPTSLSLSNMAKAKTSLKSALQAVEQQRISRKAGINFFIGRMTG
jgi:hypothetical protein